VLKILHFYSLMNGLICIFIELWILNEARVSSYIQDVLRHEEIV